MQSQIATQVVHVCKKAPATCCILKMDTLVALWTRTIAGPPIPQPRRGLADFHVISKPRDFVWILKRLKIPGLFTFSIKEPTRQRWEDWRKRREWVRGMESERCEWSWWQMSRVIDFFFFFSFFGALKACVFIVCSCLVCHGNLWENTLSRCLLTQGECKPDDVSVGVCVTKQQLNSLLPLLLYNIMKTLDGEFNWEIIVILMN